MFISSLLSSHRRFPVHGVFAPLHGVLAVTLVCLAVGCVAGSLIGCGGSNPPRVTLLLFDASGSASAAAMQERYARIAETVTSDLRGSDHVMAERITGASMQEARLQVNVQVPPFNPLHSNTIRHEQAMKETRAALKAGLPALLEGEPSKCTDLFGAFQLAGKVFQNAPTEARKRLVVVSDMVETCGSNFKQRSLDSASTSALIDAQRNAGRLPDLQDVHVWVAGATTTEKLSSERVQAIERFWLRYFEAAGADLTPARYGPTLLGWP